MNNISCLGETTEDKAVTEEQPTSPEDNAVTEEQPTPEDNAVIDEQPPPEKEVEGKV